MTPSSTQAPFVELPEEGLDLPAYLAAIERESDSAIPGSHRRKPKSRRRTAAHQAHDPRREAQEIRTAITNATTIFLLDDPRRRTTHVVSCRRTRRSASYSSPAAGAHPDAEMKWFQRGRLWQSPEDAKKEFEKAKAIAHRGRDWRPGGEHRDPREAFRKKKRERNQARRQERFERKHGDADAKRADRFKPESGKPLASPRPRDRHSQSREHLEEATPTMILHVVLFRPRKDLSAEARQGLAEAFAHAIDEISAIKRVANRPATNAWSTVRTTNARGLHPRSESWNSRTSRA